MEKSPRKHRDDKRECARGGQGEKLRETSKTMFSRLSTPGWGTHQDDKKSKTKSSKLSVAMLPRTMLPPTTMHAHQKIYRREKRKGRKGTATCRKKGSAKRGEGQIQEGRKELGEAPHDKKAEMSLKRCMISPNSMP